MAVDSGVQIGDYQALRDSFRRALLAQNKAPRTIATYLAAVDELGAFLLANGMPSRLANIRREHIEHWVADLLSRHRASTVSVRYRAVQQFYRWAMEEGELDASPMARMRPPIVPEEPPPVVGEDALRKLLRVTEGRDLASRRDHALILLLADTGMRRAECGGLSVADLDLDDCIVQVCLPGRAEVDISKAPGLVSIGRGIGAVENLALAESLADKLGGTNLVVTPGS